ncbi:MAG: LEA type 2 family protein [Bacteroidales bacterium]|jgi:LEA14-like dessication related protein|nr:LEA type 2 family protein [Bacteroidales bacterium]
MIKLKNVLFPLALLIMILTISGCNVLNQVSQVQQLALCEFDVHGVDKVRIAGIELAENMDRDDLNTAQLMQLTAAIFQKKMPVDFDLLLNINNPNDKPAAMNRMDYELFIDNKQILTGQMNQPVNVGANTNSTIPMAIQLDLFKVLNDETQSTLVNLAFKLTGDESDPAEILLKVKPYIKVGGRELAYPGFLNVRHTLK